MGLPRHDVALAQGHVAEDGTQVHEHGHEAHVGQFAVMLHALTANGSHHVAAEEAELGLGVNPLQGRHQVRGVQVAAGLAHYEIIFHACSNLLVISSMASCAVTSMVVGVMAT